MQKPQAQLLATTTTTKDRIIYASHIVLFCRAVFIYLFIHLFIADENM